VSGLQIASAVGRFVDFKHAELLLEADTHGDLDHALPYLQRSPIGPAIGSQFMALRGSGELHAQLQLSLPLANIEQRKVMLHVKRRRTCMDDNRSECSSRIGVAWRQFVLTRSHQIARTLCRIRQPLRSLLRACSGNFALLDVCYGSESCSCACNSPEPRTQNCERAGPIGLRWR